MNVVFEEEIKNQKTHAIEQIDTSFDFKDTEENNKEQTPLKALNIQAASFKKSYN